MALRRTLATLALLAVGAAGCGEPARLQGRWQSNAEKTLADIARVSLDEAILVAEADLFGRLQLEYQGKRVRVYDPGWATDAGDIPWMPYRVLGEGPDYLDLRIGSPEQGFQETRLIFEGLCYKQRQPGKDWHEFFCKVDSR